jgi:hypothetical protein
LEAAERVEALYDEMLSGIGARDREIGSRPIAVQWPHRGGGYGGTLIVGQSVYGWADEWLASDFSSPARRATIIGEVRARNRDRDDPMDWIATSTHRTSPFWNICERLAEALEPQSTAAWHARIAWANLYPAGPDDPPDNPRGPLRDAQDPVVGRFLRAIVEMLDPSRVIVFGGSYWEPTGGDSGLDRALAAAKRPLMRTGIEDGRIWVVGWHPTGASDRGFGPPLYAGIVRDAVVSLELAKVQLQVG